MLFCKHGAVLLLLETVGSKRWHRVLTSTEDYSGSILRICPEVFINRYVAVTCVDGGVMRPRTVCRDWPRH